MFNTTTRPGMLRKLCEAIAPTHFLISLGITPNFFLKAAVK